MSEQLRIDSTERLPQEFVDELSRLERIAGWTPTVLEAINVFSHLDKSGRHRHWWITLRAGHRTWAMLGQTDLKGSAVDLFAHLHGRSP